MTIAPFLIVIDIAVIITLALGCFVLAIAWNRAEAEIATLRKHRIGRATGVSPHEVR